MKIAPLSLQVQENLAKNLLAMAVGIKQKKVVDEIVQKVHAIFFSCGRSIYDVGAIFSLVVHKMKHLKCLFFFLIIDAEVTRVKILIFLLAVMFSFR